MKKAMEKYAKKLMAKKWPRPLMLLPLIVFSLIVIGLTLSLVNGGGAKPKFALHIDAPAPATILPVLGKSEKKFSAQDWLGKNYIVNFFATWCVPCQAEHELLVRLAKEKLPIIGIAYKDNPKAVRGFLKQEGNPFAIVGEDKDGRVGIDWGITGVPETFIIDAMGIIRFHYAGPLTDEIIKHDLLPAWRGLKR